MWHGGESIFLTFCITHDRKNNLNHWCAIFDGHKKSHFCDYCITVYGREFFQLPDIKTSK